MKVIQIPLNPFSMNCYIYYDEKSGDGVIIDLLHSLKLKRNRFQKLSVIIK